MFPLKLIERLCFHDLVEFVAAHFFVLNEVLGDLVQLVDVLGENRAGSVVALSDQCAHFVVEVLVTVAGAL